MKLQEKTFLKITNLDTNLDGLLEKDAFNILYSKQKSKISFREFFYGYCSLKETLHKKN